MKDEYKDVKDLLEVILTKREKLVKKCKVCRDKIDSLEKSKLSKNKDQEKFREELKSYMPEMFTLDNQIGALSKALGARSIKEPTIR